MPDTNEPEIQRPSQRFARISAHTGKPVEEIHATASHAPVRQETVFNAAERAAEFYDHLRAHYRKSKRVPVEIDAAIKIIMDGIVLDSGSAVVMNVSPSGALLGKVKLKNNCYPVRPFKLEVVMQGGDYDGIGIEARPIRFEHDHGGLGVRFEEIFVTA